MAAYHEKYSKDLHKFDVPNPWKNSLARLHFPDYETQLFVVKNVLRYPPSQIPPGLVVRDDFNRLYEQDLDICPQSPVPLKRVFTRGRGILKKQIFIGSKKSVYFFHGLM